MKPYDFLLPAIVLLSVLICAFTLLPAFQVSDTTTQKGKKHFAPDEFLRYRKSWLKTELIFLVVKYMFILLSFTATCLLIYILVVNNDPEQYKVKVILYSVLSLLFSFISIILKPEKYAEGNRAAFLKLHNAITDYEYSPFTEGSRELQKLQDHMVKALQEGEESIAKGAGL